MAAWTYDDPRTYWQQDLSPADIQSMMAAWDSQGPGGRALINGYGFSRAMDRAPMSDAQDTAPQEVVGSGIITRPLNHAQHDVFRRNL